MKGPRWTPAEDELMRSRYPTTRAQDIADALGRPISQVYSRAKVIGLSKSAEWIAEPTRIAMRRKDHGGRKTQFSAGHETWNKGQHYTAGGRSKETRFQPGQKPHTWRPIGTERVTKDGYLQRKVGDTRCTRRDYRFVHHLVWEAAGRMIPKGFSLCFVDGDRRNFALDNLELVSRADLMRRNTVHRLPEPLKEVIRMRAGICKRITMKERKHAQAAHD